MPEPLSLFVYGTLLDGGPQAGLLEGLARRPATVQGRLYDLPAGYPALALPGEGLVHGQLVEAPAERVLRLLDLYEGVHEGLYAREVVQVRLPLKLVRAWTYVMADPEARGGRLVPTGRWRPRRLR